MIGLTGTDKHHWGPVPQVVAWLAQRLPDDARVLEVGPGHQPFPRASVFVDFADVPGMAQGTVHRIDAATAKLPFPDKSFDFVYARHVLEDSHNPFHLAAEMSRVAHAGYVETPSPIAELTRGVDGGTPPYRGYHHHRFMLWQYQTELRAVSKYPLVEYLSFDEARQVELLRQGPKYWNSYFLWEGSINIQHRQSPLHFDIPRDYAMLLNDAVKQSVTSTDEFWQQVPDKLEVMQALPRIGAAA